MFRFFGIALWQISALLLAGRAIFHEKGGSCYQLWESLLTENNLTNIVAGDQNINPNGLLFKFLPTVSSASLVSRVNGDEFSTGAMIDHK